MVLRVFCHLFVTLAFRIYLTEKCHTRSQPSLSIRRDEGQETAYHLMKLSASRTHMICALITLQTSVSDQQFPPHVDLQKVGEAIFNNEKFNILKTTTHIITDQFKEFMLREKNNNDPGKKVFIDKNGFKHDWSGFGEIHKSLRKTELINENGSFVNKSENTPDFETISMDVYRNTIGTIEDDRNISSLNTESNEHEDKNNASENNDTVENSSNEYNETDDIATATTINLVAATLENNSTTEISLEKRLRKGGKNDNKDKVPKPAEQAPIATAKPAAKNQATNAPTNAPTNKENNKEKTDTKERTVVQTTFFCPYLGIITMSGFIDL